MNFKEFFYDVFLENYTPRKGDIFFHGSLKDFDDITPDVNGLVSVTRNVAHAMEYAHHTPFASSQNTTGFVYAYKIDPNCKIFDATNDENFREIFGRPYKSRGGYTEIIQQPHITKKILDSGYDGILQKQANIGYYGELSPKRIKRHEYNKYEGKEKYYVSPAINNQTSIDFSFDGTQVLGIKSNKLILYKKIPYDEIPQNNSKDPFKYMKS